MDKLPTLPGMGSKFFEATTSQDFEGIKKQLNSKGVKEKMEGMKKIVKMLAKGQDISSMFPEVVKNVHCKDMTLKKLVYLYIVHYAEAEEDAALLAINNFQRDLVNENAILRALGLRTLSSLRIPVICQVVVLCIGKAIRDSSPYVRKAAALALPKVYSLDPEQLPDIMDIIERLLDDTHCMVLGSAMVAFMEICPERYDLLHPHYRKICHYLVDFDEWAQITTLQLLVSYGRNQFGDPDGKDDEEEEKTKLKDDEEDSWEKGSDTSESSDDLFNEKSAGDLDPDHRLLLSSALPLLRSRNTGVVLAVASLYFYLAPKLEAQKIAKHLVCICRGRREQSYITLANVATMAALRPGIFEPYIADFFVYDSEPNFSRLLKLEILTLLANEGNVTKVLMEMNFYVKSENTAFVAHTIQAIGRIAARIPDCADSCMRTLMSLIADREEEVVAESVIVMKKLLQTGQKGEFPMEEILIHLSTILETIRVPMARASITWVIGEYHNAAPQIAPDVLRILIKGFREESSLVKLQILNLGSKIFVTNPEQTRLLFRYALELARYDMDYDVRDRARVMRAILLGSTPALSKHASRLFITEKPTPIVKAPNEGRKEYTLGTTTHMVAHRVLGYQPLCDYPEVPLDTDRTPKDAGKFGVPDVPGLGEGSFSSGSSESWFSGSESSYSSRSRSGSWSSSYSGSSRSRSGSWSSSYSGSGSRSRSGSWSSEYSEDDQGKQINGSNKEEGGGGGGVTLDDLMGGLNLGKTDSVVSSKAKPLVLLSHVAGNGLAIYYKFDRQMAVAGPEYNTVGLSLVNTTEEPIQSIRIGGGTVSGGVVAPLPEIMEIQPGDSVTTTIDVAFSSASEPITFDITANEKTSTVSLRPDVGELVKGLSISETEFNEKLEELGGLHENTSIVKLSMYASDNVVACIVGSANLAACFSNETEGLFYFAGTIISSEEIVLVTAQLVKESDEVRVRTNCGASVLGTQLHNKIVACLSA